MVLLADVVMVLISIIVAHFNGVVVLVAAVGIVVPKSTFFSVVNGWWPKSSEFMKQIVIFGDCTIITNAQLLLQA